MRARTGKIGKIVVLQLGMVILLVSGCQSPALVSLPSVNARAKTDDEPGVKVERKQESSSIQLVSHPCPWSPIPCCPPPVYQAPMQMPPAKETAPESKEPAKDRPAPKDEAPRDSMEPQVNPEQSSATGGGESFASAAPNVIGDGSVTITVTTFVGTTPVTTTQTITTPDIDTAAAITARASAFKVSENESPRPQTRLFFNYNYFANVNNLNTDVHREMTGFEYAFLDGNASFGMRIPVYQCMPTGTLNIDGFGNLSLLGKYAWIYDRQAGNVLSSGLVVTPPTGRGIRIPGQKSIRDVIIQPWLGYIVPMDTWYGQGFTAVAAPTDSRDVTLLFSDLALGYWAVRNNNPTGLTGLVPTLEAHVIAPLNHVGLNSIPFGVQDSLVFTTGVHAIFAQRSIFTLGVITPVTGPQPFNIEALAMFNYLF